MNFHLKNIAIVMQLLLGKAWRMSYAQIGREIGERWK